MDNLEHYRSLIKSILTGYHEIPLAQAHLQNDSEATDRLAFDEQRDQHPWFRFGWENKTLVEHIIIYLCMANSSLKCNTCSKLMLKGESINRASTTLSLSAKEE